MSEGKYESRIRMVGDKLVVRVGYEGFFIEEDFAFVSGEGRNKLQGKKDFFTTELCFRLGGSNTKTYLKSIYDRSSAALDSLAEQLKVYSESGREPDVQLVNLALRQINEVKGVK
jgi:hypothetical protein